MTAEHNSHRPQEINTTIAQNPCQQGEPGSIATTETWIRTEKGEVRVKKEVVPGITVVSRINNQ